MVQELIALTEETYGRFDRAARQVLSQRRLLGGQAGFSPAHRCDTIGGENQSAEQIPAYSIVAVTDSFVEDDRRILKIDKPQAGPFQRTIAVTGPEPIEPQQRGRVHLNGLVRVAFDSGSPAAGEGWGVRPGQWTASKGWPGLQVVGVDDSGDDQILLAILDSPIPAIVAKPDSTLARNGTGNGKVWCGDAGSESDSGWTLSVHNRIEQVAGGQMLACQWISDRWQVAAILNQPARYILGRLVGDLLTSQATKQVSIVDAWDGVTPGSSATARNTQSLFSGANNKLVLSRWKPEALEYQMVWVECPGSSPAPPIVGADLLVLRFDSAAFVTPPPPPPIVAGR